MLLPGLQPRGLRFAARHATTVGGSPPGTAGRTAPPAADAVLPASALNQLLDSLETGAIRYFIEQRTPDGLVLDRAPLSGPNPCRMASLSATGFGLAAWVLAMEKGILPRQQVRRWVLQTLDTVEAITRPEQKGWLAHFVDKDTGALWPGTEISSIDTALFFLGAIAAGEALGGAARRKVNAMFNRVDFKVMLTEDGRKPEQKAFSLGFLLQPSPTARLPQQPAGEPGRKYLPYRWDEYSEGILIPLLALGSRKHKVPDSVWTEGWRRQRNWHGNGQSTFVNLPLFTYFYPHAFLNLRNRVDGRGDDFWAASRAAVALQQGYCRDHGYPEGMFGITACDGPGGYQIYSAQEISEDTPDGRQRWRFDDGTLAPAAIMACLPLAETEVRRLLPRLQAEGLLSGTYGASCGYNVNTGWRAPEAVGIDLGSMLLMIDAYRRGRIHQWTGQSGIIRRAMQRAGFRPAPPA